MSAKQYKPFIDVAKFLCALLVVIIHCLEIPNSPIASLIVECFSAQAVPFFFIVSGYFFARKIDSGLKLRSLFYLCVKNCIWCGLCYGSLIILIYIQKSTRILS